MWCIESPAFDAPACTLGKLVVVSMNALENTYGAFKKHSGFPIAKHFNTAGHSLLTSSSGVRSRVIDQTLEGSN